MYYDWRVIECFVEFMYNIVEGKVDFEVGGLFGYGVFFVG